MYLAKFAPPHIAQRSGTGGYVRGSRQVFALGPVAPGGPRAGTLRRPWGKVSTSAEADESPRRGHPRGGVCALLGHPLQGLVTAPTGGRETARKGVSLLILIL